MRRLGGILIAIVLITACGRMPEPKQYEMRGQILGVDAGRREVLVSHDDIKGFMPAMTMPYRVKDDALLEGKQPGDLFTATLVVEDTTAYLSTLATTGRAPITMPVGSLVITDADLVKVGEALPEQNVVDQSGTRRSLTSSLRGHRAVLTFMYTRCPLPDFCPLMDKHFAALQAQIKKSPDLSDVRLVSVTVDPDFDTPSVLEKHARDTGADLRVWQFVTGPRADVLAFTKTFGVVTESGESPNIVVHNLRTAVIDAQGRIAAIHSGNMWTPADIVADLKKAPASQH